MKLVRDHVPELLAQQGITARWHIAGRDEYWRLLIQKFEEEAREFVENPDEAELSDVIELLDQIIEQKDPERVAWMRAEKARVKGTFSRRVVLDD